MRPLFLCAGALACCLSLCACRDGAESEFAAHGAGAGEPGGGAGAGGSGNGSSNGGSSNGGSSNGGPSSGGASNGGSSNGGSSNGGSSAGTDGGGGSAAGSAGSNGGPHYRVFASTDTELFALDPEAPDLPLLDVGAFNCIDPANGPFTSMVDIAVDRFQDMWGLTAHSVMPLILGGGMVHCGPAIALSNPAPGQAVPTFYALTFAPQGVLDPLKEVLVAGNTAGELWSIDAAGSIEQHGRFGLVPADDGHGHTYDAANVGKPWELSGDLVFLANEGDPVGFATVRDCPSPPSTSGCSKTDTLLEIDMAKLKAAGDQVVALAVRGKILKKQDCPPGAVDGSMFGIAAWNATVFGFSRTGRVVSIDSADGGSCMVKAYLEDHFSGAAVTTIAPVIAPPLQ